ncbi:MAG: glycosyltransferase, partial [Candidatus Marinimicrobia bacterium]|nr:glycosyltransferase [Candidatus Neomarinimicrobiota bacterium]
MIYLITCISVVLYFLFIIFIISGLFKHESPNISSSKDLPMVSVVIAARNEDSNLPDLIYDLVNQEYPLDKLEVIFVNDRSTDLTNRILNEASDNYSFIKQIVIEELSAEMTPKKYALTKGIESANGEIIISTDADCRVGKLWVSSMTSDVIKSNGISIGFSKISDKSFFDQYQKIDFLGIISANAGAGG